MTTHQLTHDLRRAFLAGHATVTVVNTATQERFTYKITRCENNPELFFVGVLTSPDNLTGYTCFGIVRQGVYAHRRKSPISPEAPSVKAFVWIWRNLDRLPGTIEVWHAGHCLRCGRLLTVPSSVASGYGPECTKLMRAA